MDCGEEVSRGFVVARDDGATLLELAEEILDEVARLVRLFVVVTLDFAVALGRDDDGFSSGKQWLDDTFIGIEGLVSRQGVGCHVGQQRVGALQIMGLARRQQKFQRITQRVGKRVNLGAQPAFAAPDRFVFAFFFWAPALC